MTLISFTLSLVLILLIAIASFLKEQD
jgi:hypothetical protein